MPTPIEAITPHLTPRRAALLQDAVRKLDVAIQSGIVRNVDFTSAKDTINRAVEEGAEAFLASGPHEKGRNGTPHNQSDWWLAAYDAGAFVNGASNVPAALKRATRAGIVPYVEFLTALVPLHALLQVARPMIAKRGDARIPVEKTEAQIEREANSMTCQCCGRGILANMGHIAHHGYERPGHGWQTGSCAGALDLPFEVSRDKLGWLIKSWTARRNQMITTRREIDAERAPVPVTVFDKSQPRSRAGVYPLKALSITRENFGANKGDLLQWFSFEELKQSIVQQQAAQIASLVEAIKEAQARFNGWKQTHYWNKLTGSWELLP